MAPAFVVDYCRRTEATSASFNYELLVLYVNINAEVKRMNSNFQPSGAADITTVLRIQGGQPSHPWKCLVNWASLSVKVTEEEYW